ncbi:MAG: class I mannose-6-phosphate isomerase [Planctomycetes bacterium]|nr:class I mannose-6-phosphate isomerase [Planctomycetota bacterium]
MYPLRFQRIEAAKPWAGARLRRLFPAQAAEVPPGTGEWIELCDFPGQSSVVANGEWRGQTLHDLARARRTQLLGELAVDAPDDFPLCVKFLDTAQPLSIQDHPSDVREAADKRLIRRGKSECWLVLDAAPGAVIYQGLRQGVTAAQFGKALVDGDPPALLNARAVKPGDFLYNAAGMVHAIGADLALLEIQQNCPTTYRLWDFPRPGIAEKREMHVQPGLAAARHDLPLPKIVPTHGSDVLLAPDGPFGVRSLRISSAAHEAKAWPGFTLHTCLKGECEITGRARDNLQPTILMPGETVLWPAEFTEFELYPRGDCWLIVSWARE